MLYSSESSQGLSEAPASFRAVSFKVFALFGVFILLMTGTASVSADGSSVSSSVAAADDDDLVAPGDDDDELVAPGGGDDDLVAPGDEELIAPGDDDEDELVAPGGEVVSADKPAAPAGRDDGLVAPGDDDEGLIAPGDDDDDELVAPGGAPADKPAVPAEPAEPAPAEPAKPVAPAVDKPAVDKPAVPAEPAEPAPAEPAKPAASAEDKPAASKPAADEPDSDGSDAGKPDAAEEPAAPAGESASEEKPVVRINEPVLIPAPAGLAAGAKDFNYGPGVAFGFDPGDNRVPTALFLGQDGSLKGTIIAGTAPGKYVFPVVYAAANGGRRMFVYEVTVLPEPGSANTSGALLELKLIQHQPTEITAYRGGKNYKLSTRVVRSTVGGANRIPAGLTLGEDGILRGQITAAEGVYTFPVIVTKEDGAIVRLICRITVLRGISAETMVKIGESVSIPAPADLPADAKDLNYDPEVAFATEPGTKRIPLVLFLGQDGSLKGEIVGQVKPGVYSFPVFYTDAAGIRKVIMYKVTAAVDIPATSSGAEATGNQPGDQEEGADSDASKAADGTDSGDARTGTGESAGTAGANSAAQAGSADAASDTGSAAKASGAAGNTASEATDSGSAASSKPSADSAADDKTPASSAGLVSVKVTQRQSTAIAAYPGGKSYKLSSRVVRSGSPGANRIPRGLTLQSDGSIQGEATANPGAYTFPVIVTKPDGSKVRVVYRLTVVR